MAYPHLHSFSKDFWVGVVPSTHSDVQLQALELVIGDHMQVPPCLSVYCFSLFTQLQEGFLGMVGPCTYSNVQLQKHGG